MNRYLVTLHKNGNGAPFDSRERNAPNAVEAVKRALSLCPTAELDTLTDVKVVLLRVGPAVPA